MLIESDEIHIRPSDYVREMMLRCVGRWWWMVVLPFTGCLIAGAWNAAFLFVAFIWLFQVFPPMLMFVYLTYCLRPEVQHVVRAYRLSVSDDSITVVFSEEDGAPDMPRRIIPWESVTGMSLQRKFMILELHRSRYNLLFIPVDSFPPESSRLLIARLFDLACDEKV